MKAYVAGEPHRDHVIELLAAGASATCRISEVEVASALCRRAREGHFLPIDRDRALADLQRDMTRLVVVEVTPALTADTHALLVRHALRAADALHLAAALRLRASLGRQIRFIGFDDRLNVAAGAEGFALVCGA